MVGAGPRINDTQNVQVITWEYGLHQDEGNERFFSKIVQTFQF